MSFFLRQHTAGLAYSQKQVALAVMTHQRQNSRLEHLVTTPALNQTVDALTDTIRMLVTLTGCRGWPTAIALPTQHTIERDIRMASGQTDLERDTELREHFTDYLPGDYNHLCIDHSLIYPQSSNKTEEHLRVVTAKEETVHAAVSLVENAGLVVRIVDIDHYAKDRALKYSPFTTGSYPSHIDKTLLESPTDTILIALGLGLRRCPTW